MLVTYSSFHVVIFLMFSFIWFEVYSMDFSKMTGYFFWSLELPPVISPYSITGSYIPNGRFSPFIDTYHDSISPFFWTWLLSYLVPKLDQGVTCSLCLWDNATRSWWTSISRDFSTIESLYPYPKQALSTCHAHIGWDIIEAHVETMFKEVGLMQNQGPVDIN